MRKTPRENPPLIGSIRFTGGSDEYIIGVPARDLTVAEWDRLPAALQEKCLVTGLYAPDKQDADDDPFPEEGEIS